MIEDYKPITAIMIGAGSRGNYAYGDYAVKNPKRINFIGVAEPDEFKRKQFQTQHSISDEFVFSTWEEILDNDLGKIADVAFICTPDLLHYEPAIKALILDYHLVLEKPIAPTIEQCREIENLAKKKKKYVQICHVLRYTPFWTKIKNVIDSGEIGDVLHYEHSENVSFWHFSHSYVRGIFKNTDHSAPFILAKTCHDLDLMYWLLDKQPNEVQATGGVGFYKPENAPENATKRCIDGCPHEKSCPWYAPDIYITAKPFLSIGKHSSNSFVRFFTKYVLSVRPLLKILSIFIKPLKNFLNWQHWPATVMTNDLSIEGKMKALKETDYGKCVFYSDNNQPDHIQASFTFDDGTGGTLISMGISDLEGREIRIFGSKGSIRGYFRYSGERIWVTDLKTSNKNLIHKRGISFETHGGADVGMMEAFTSFMLGEKTPKEAGYSDISEAMESHYMGFAVEEARKNKTSLNMSDFRQKIQ